MTYYFKKIYQELMGTKARRQLLLSLMFNFIAKLPGILSIFFVLPIVSKSLGSEMYGSLLAAIGLGSSFCFPLGGIKTVGRRRLAQAFGAGDKEEQSQVFVTIMSLMSVLSVSVMFLVGYVSLSSWDSGVLIFICMLPVLASFLDSFDSIRASFNEHYVTAKLQFGSQVIIYGAVIFLGLPQGALLLCALILFPYAYASIGTMFLLLFRRRYLLHGKIKGLKSFFLSSLAVTFSTGVLSSIMGFVIYWVSQNVSADYAAWIGTFNRLFITFLSPLMLILFPLTSFISIHWEALSLEQKIKMHLVFVIIGLGMGTLIASAIGIAAPFYIDYMFDFTVKGELWDVIALSVFLGAIVAQKMYSMLLYSFCEGLFMSYGSIAIVLIGGFLATISYFWLPAKESLNVLFFTIGLGLPVLLLFESWRQQEELKHKLVIFRSETDQI